MEITKMSKFWQDQWENELKEYPLPILEKEEKMQIETWDEIAKANDDASLGMGEERIREVIDVLRTLKLITKESKVLDIGCGTGAYTLPFADMCKSVEAVDFSPEMLRGLQEQIKQKGISNVQITKSNFEQFVENAKNEQRTYDLVFASMNPGLYSGDSILKMSKLSSGSCVYIAPSQITNQAQSELSFLLEEPMEQIAKGNNVIYPFSMLYYMGCSPQMFYTNYDSTKHEEKEQMIERLVKYFSKRRTKAVDIKKAIVKYVEDNVRDGLVEDRTAGLVGILIWKP